ncbi:MULTISPECIES: RNA 2',3'-cyclic phosphodiesterase [unclassified Marinovum]
MRLFVALPLPEPLCDDLGDLQTGLHVGRLVPLDQMHVTLAFFAEVTEQQLDDLDAVLGDLDIWPFDVDFVGLDLFGGTKPRLLAAMIRPTPELDHLHRAVQSAARAAGLAPHRQKFRPHVTLARFGNRPHPGVHGAVQEVLSDKAGAKIAGFTAESVVLTRSTLGGGAPIYEDLAQYPFHPLPPDEWQDG